MKAVYPISIIIICLFSCSAKKIGTGKNQKTYTLITTPRTSDRGDAVFSLIVPDNNYGKSEDIHIYAWTQQGELNVNRVLLDFNLDSIPSTAIIDSAYLDLYYNPVSRYDAVLGQNGGQGTESIVIERVISEWKDLAVTWRTQPKVTEQNQQIILRKQDPKADYTHIDITPIVRDIIQQENRYGIRIRHSNEKPYNVLFFASGDHPDTILHPTLKVYYKKK